MQNVMFTRPPSPSRLEAGELLIKTEGLTREYRKFAAIEDVNFELRAGECVGLIGPNGGGKTTFLSLLCGFNTPTRGNVSFHSILENRRERGLHIGFFLDEAAVPFNLTVAQYLRLEAKLRKIDPGVVDQFINDYELRPHRNKRFKSLSSGWRRRALIVSLLMIEPELMILDEPTNSLDIESITWLREIINQRTAAGLTSLISSHNHYELAQVITRAMIIKQQVRYDGKLDELAPDGNIEEAYYRLTGTGPVRAEGGAAEGAPAQPAPSRNDGAARSDNLG